MVDDGEKSRVGLFNIVALAKDPVRFERADNPGRKPEDLEAAFQEDDNSLRPFIEKVQREAIAFGLETFAPRSEEAIRARNTRFSKG